MKYVFFLFLCICFSGCFLNKEPEVINIDNSEPLALVPSIQWAVINDPFAAFREEAGWEFPVKQHCRRGEIYQITGNKTVKNTDGLVERWLCFEYGWIPESAVSVCANLYNAKTVAEELKK